jgi:type I restriction enzyme R subunit
MKFTEAKLEQAFIELLGNEDYPHFVGSSLVRGSEDEVLIEEDLKNYLLKRYKKEKLTETEAQSIILQLKTLSSADLYESNKKIMRWLADGFILKERTDNKRIFILN